MPKTISSRCFSVILLLEAYLPDIIDYLDTAHDKFPIEFVAIGGQSHGKSIGRLMAELVAVGAKLSNESVYLVIETIDLSCIADDAVETVKIVIELLL